VKVRAVGRFSFPKVVTFVALGERPRANLLERGNMEGGTLLNIIYIVEYQAKLHDKG
jgi:hypothetical protein